MLMQQKNKMIKPVTTADFTMVLDSSDVLKAHSCSVPQGGGIAGAAF